MERLISCCILFFLIVSIWCKTNQEQINSDLVNTNVERKIDTSSHLLKIITTLTLENVGGSAIRSFLYVVDPPLRNRLSFIGAMIRAGDDELDTKLTVDRTTVQSHSEEEVWKVTLSSPLDAGKMVVVEVDAVFSHTLVPYPSHITQAEKQFVLLTANLYYYSAYKTTTQKTMVTTTSSTIESHTKSPKPVSQSDNSITYGPYSNQEAFNEMELQIHSENNSPFLAVTTMERIIELSHWGNIAVEEHFEVRHTGATLKGSFSRYDYQRSQDGMSSIKSFKTVLPAAATDVYYRDEIGNISTSNLRELDDMVELELRPRFPLFGGWKTQYYMGYNVPSYQYLFNEGDQYVLKMSFIDHVFDDMVVDQMTLRIILPEGARNIQLVPPYAVDREENELHFTYLDTIGRPVIIAKKTSLVEQHIQDFELHYTFQKMMMLQEPLLVVVAFYLFFLIVIVYVRMDFSITKNEAKESRMRIASLVEEVQSTQDKRSALYQSYDDAINKYKSNKDNAAFQNGRKKIDADYRHLTHQMTALQGQLKLEGSEAAEKVAELQRLDSQYKEQIGLAVVSTEKLVNGKLAKQQYVDSDRAINSKCAELYQKMETLRASF